MAQSRRIKTRRDLVFHQAAMTAEPHFGGRADEIDFSRPSQPDFQPQHDIQRERLDVSALLLEDDVVATAVAAEPANGNGLEWDDEIPIVAPPTHASAHELTTEVEPPNRARILNRLLAMADTYRGAGSLRQAVEMYFELIRDYAETPQALAAEDRLIDVALHYETAGELRQARGIYEQLL